MGLFDREPPTPITVNGKQYYFRNISGGEGYSSYVQFYVKVNEKQRHVKRKYWFFGKILSDEMVDVEYHKCAFQTSRFIDSREIYNVIDIKSEEQKYCKKVQIETGKLEI